MKKEIKWNSSYMKGIYQKLGFDINKHPLTLFELKNFLKSKKIKILISNVDGKFTWYGCDLIEDNVFSEDFTVYTSSNDALETAVMESACYLNFKLEH